MAGQDDICCLWRTQTLIFKFRILVQEGGGAGKGGITLAYIINCQNTVINASNLPSPCPPPPFHPPSN